MNINYCNTIYTVHNEIFELNNANYKLAKITFSTFKCIGAFLVALNSQLPLPVLNYLENVIQS